MRFDLHAQRNQVTDSEFSHLGGAGILLAGYGIGAKDVHRNNDILNNAVHHIGEILAHSGGIFAWQSGYNHIAHNELHDLPYAGILATTRVRTSHYPLGEGGRTIRLDELPQSVREIDLDGSHDEYESWLAREPYLHSRQNLIEYNDISDTVQVLTDGNPIYVSGAGTGNVVRYNYLHDNDARTVTETIRLDDDQHHTRIFGNIIERSSGYSTIATKGVNHIINNFIVHSAPPRPRATQDPAYISFQWSSARGSIVRNNIIVSDGTGGEPQGEWPWPDIFDVFFGPRGEGAGVPRLEETLMDSNIYHHPTDPDWARDHVEHMREFGLETETLLTDPGFVDYEGGDYRFSRGSPARMLGIEPLDRSLMGRRP